MGKFDEWKGPAIVVTLVCGIFWAGYSYYQINATAAAQEAINNIATSNGNRISVLEENTRAVKDSLAEIKASLRELNAEVRAQR